MNDFTYLLDTNIVSDLVRHPSGKTARRIKNLGENRICASIVVASELRYGAREKGSATVRKATKKEREQYESNEK